MPAFTTAIMQKYDSVKARALLSRNDQSTEINYYGRQGNYTFLNSANISDSSFDPSVFKGKIVLIGYMGTPASNAKMLDEDMFFTPFNIQLSGRSFPDMYGMLIHANILRMELDNDFIYRLPTWLNWLLAFILSWAVLPLFIRWWVHKAVWFHLYTMLLQLFVSILFIFITIMLYAKAKIKIESSAILVAVLLLNDFVLFYDSIVQFLKRKMKLKFHSRLFEAEE